MKIKKWLKANTASLEGKTVLVTGSTGGIGRALCDNLAALGATLILLDRNAARASARRATLLQRYPKASITCVQADLSDITSVKAACDKLALLDIDVLIHNAGAYSIPRYTCDTGLDNVFQINFASPYYLTRTLLPQLRARGGHVVAVGSIAHHYAKFDVNDVDFSTRRRASLVYGNAKRYLMFSLAALFENEREVTFSLAHPGISFTGITAHYPKPIFALIKHPMKVIFMKPKRACLSVLRAVFLPCDPYSWIGPRLFGIWGLPRRYPLRSANEQERAHIFRTAEQIYKEM